MANLKPVEPLSDWQTYEIENTILDPPIIRLRLKPVENLAVYDIPQGEEVKRSKIAKELLFESVVEWDLTMDGKPIPCTDENKRKYLPLFLGNVVKGTQGYLGFAILAFAADLENFLKN
jgi:hypothetical protein